MAGGGDQKHHRRPAGEQGKGHRHVVADAEHQINLPPKTPGHPELLQGLLHQAGGEIAPEVEALIHHPTGGQGSSLMEQGEAPAAIGLTIPHDRQGLQLQIGSERQQLVSDQTTVEVLAMAIADQQNPGRTGLGHGALQLGQP